MSTFCDHCELPVGPGGVEGASGGAIYCCYGCRMLDETGADDPEDDRHQALLVRVFAGALMAAFVMVLSLAISSGYGFDGVRQLQHDVSTAHWVLLLVAVPALLVLGVPVARAAARSLWEGRLTLDVLFALGTTSAVAVSAVSYGRGTGPIYLETAVMLLALYTLGRYLTARAKGRTTQVLGRLLEVPDATYERLGPDPGTVEPSNLHPGDRVRIRAGDVVPVDGRILSGESFVDESSLTGEARPAPRTAGDRLYAGTTPLDGALTITVTAVGEERRLAQIEQMMERALQRPSRVQRLANRIMRVLIPGVVVLALATFAGWYLAAGFEKALYTSLSVVLITCPCALGIAIPLSLVVGLGEAGRDGVLVRDGDTLLDLAGVRSVVFDKTGTLTSVGVAPVQVYTATQVIAEAVIAEAGRRGAPAPGGVRRASATAARPSASARHAVLQASARPEDEGDTLLRLAASLEATTRHPIAQAVAHEAERRGLSLVPVSSSETVPGAGIVGTVRRPEPGQEQPSSPPDGADGAPVQVGVGSKRLLDRMNAACPDALAQRAREEASAGRTAVYVVVEDAAAGLLVLDEHISAFARDAVRALQDADLDVRVLTGDRPAAGRRVEDELGVPVEAALTPEAKARRIEALRRKHDRVAMVGDGINDAVAIAEADVGLALTSGAGVSIEAAGVALYNPDLRMLPRLVDLARRTRRIIHQNLYWTFGYNGIGLALAVAGWLHPIAAVAVMTASSAFVTWNAYRIGKGELGHSVPEHPRAQASSPDPSAASHNA
jgi:cation transport ATPase